MAVRYSSNDTFSSPDVSHALNIPCSATTNRTQTLQTAADQRVFPTLSLSLSLSEQSFHKFQHDKSLVYSGYYLPVTLSHCVTSLLMQSNRLDKTQLVAPDTLSSVLTDAFDRFSENAT